MKRLKPGLRLTAMMVVLERAAPINASRRKLPNIIIRGCFFLSHNACGENIQVQDCNFSWYLGKLAAFAYILGQHVIAVFEQLVHSDNFFRANENLLLEVGLKIYHWKTVEMRLNSVNQGAITVGNTSIKRTDVFCYLGSYNISADGGTELGVTSRINTAEVAFFQKWSSYCSILVSLGS